MHGVIVAVGLALAGAAAVGDQTATPRPAASAPAPPDWAVTKERLRDLTLAQKSEDAVALAESVVAKYPRFAEGLARLGGAHEGVARELARTDPATARVRFEAAATYLRRAFDLGGGEYPDATIRGLIDLYDYALPNPAQWKATVQEAVARYPTQPVSHWYALQLLLREQRFAEVGTRLTAARAALPATPPDARLEFASLLVSLAERSPTAAVRAALSGEALALADDTLKAHPADRFGRRATSIKEDVARLVSRTPPPIE